MVKVWSWFGCFFLFVCFFGFLKDRNLSTLKYQQEDVAATGKYEQEDVGDRGRKSMRARKGKNK